MLALLQYLPLMLKYTMKAGGLKRVFLIYCYKHPQSVVQMVLVWLFALQLLLEILTSLYYVKFWSALLKQMATWHGLTLASAAPSTSPAVLRGAGSGELWVRADLGTGEQENQNSFRRG